MPIFHYPSSSAEKKLEAISRRSLSFRKKDVQAVYPHPRGRAPQQGQGPAHLFPPVSTPRV